MWFKQVQLYQLTETTRLAPESVFEKLEPFLFTPRLPSMHKSIGWASVIEEDHAPYFRYVNGYMMFCLQIEEKILPATVVRQQLIDKIKKIETTEDRKVYRKEKLTLKDEMEMTLLPRAFTKLSRFYAYLDTKNQQLVIGTTNAKIIEHFLSLFKKTFNIEARCIDIKNISPIMTSWLKSQHYPSAFSIEKNCLMQDPSETKRLVRSQQQDLFTNGMQLLLNEGYEAIQLALTWQDRVNFVLASDFSLRHIQFQEEITSQAKEMGLETKQQQFDADFLIMTETLSLLLTELQAGLQAAVTPLSASPSLHALSTLPQAVCKISTLSHDRAQHGRR